VLGPLDSSYHEGPEIRLGRHTQDCPHPGGAFRELMHEHLGHRPRPEAASVRSPAGDRRGQPEIGLGRSPVPQLEGGEVVGIGRVGDASHGRRDTRRRQSNLQVVQGGAAADDQVAAVRVGHRQPPLAVGVEVHAAIAELPPPRLAVVHRGGADGQLDSTAHRALVDPVDDHRSSLGLRTS
jgi:hypothetical protein